MLASGKELFDFANQQGLVNETKIKSALTTAETLLAEDFCLVPAVDRLDAGYYGISSATCLSKAGTCFDARDTDAINCYFTKHHTSLESHLPEAIDAYKEALEVLVQVKKSLEEPFRRQLYVQLKDFYRRTFRMLDGDADGRISLDEAKSTEVGQLAGPPRDAFMSTFKLVLEASPKTAVALDGAAGVTGVPTLSEGTTNTAHNNAGLSDLLAALDNEGAATLSLGKLKDFIQLTDPWLENLALLLSKERLQRHRDHELRVSTPIKLIDVFVMYSCDVSRFFRLITMKSTPGYARAS